MPAVPTLDCYSGSTKSIVGRDRRLSRSVSRLGQRVSAVVDRPHRLTLVGGLPIASALEIAEAALTGASSIKLRASGGGYLEGDPNSYAVPVDGERSDVPIGWLIGLDSGDYTVTAPANVSSGVVTVSIDPVLSADVAAGDAVAVNAVARYCWSSVNLRPAAATELTEASYRGFEFQFVASFPGHLSTSWVLRGDTVTYTRPDGRVVHAGVVVDTANRGWGQVVSSGVPMLSGDPVTVIVEGIKLSTSILGGSLDLEVDGAHLAGVTAVTLRNGSGDGMTGHAPIGAGLTIDGVDYLVGVSSTTSGSLLTVSLASGLEADVADGAAVSLSSATTYTIPSSVFLSVEEYYADHADRSVSWGFQYALEDFRLPLVPGLFVSRAGMTGYIHSVDNRGVGVSRVWVGTKASATRQ